MLIAAHAGTGKSTFARMYPDKVIDLVCMPYKYEDYNYPEESEAVKANTDADFNVNWPDNYYIAVLNHLKSGKIILIPPVFDVIYKLYAADNIKYILCYPERNLKDEYEQRYIKRGNTQEFLEMFIWGWDYFIDNCEKDPYGKHVVLKSGQYLSDVIDIDSFY